MRKRIYKCSQESTSVCMPTIRSFKDNHDLLRSSLKGVHAERREYTCKYVNDICILAGTRYYNIYVHRLGKPMKK